MIYSQHDKNLKDYQNFSIKDENKQKNFIAKIFQTYQLLFDFISVTRVQPRISKGITDLLLPQTSFSLPL